MSSITPTPAEARATMLRRLADLQNRPTRHEVEAVRLDGVRALVAYTPRKSARGLLDALTSRGRQAVRFFGLPETARATVSRMVVTLDGGSVVRFSGRTQRDAVATATELPSVDELAPTPANKADQTG